jgi:hypothetical protein
LTAAGSGRGKPPIRIATRSLGSCCNERRPPTWRHAAHPSGKLGRGGEALDSTWAEFAAHPAKCTHEELAPNVPKAERDAWHKKAMDTAQRGDLDSVIQLWLCAREIERLAERLERTGDAKLESLSPYVTEPAAKRLAKAYPGVAAEDFRACAC